MNAIGENSYKIITSTEIIGISHKQRIMVANIVRYLNTPFPDYHYADDHFEKEDYIRIAKLHAILSIADAMDRSHRQKFHKVLFQYKSQCLFQSDQACFRWLQACYKIFPQK